MAVYTVTISSAGSPDIVSLTDGSTYAVLEVSAGRGPKGDGFTGGTYNASTGVVTFTSNDGIGFSTGDLRGDLSEPGPIGDVTPNTGAFTGLDLAAIAESKGVTAVDVFVYDTSRDSDGGAWRKRTQHTSWYNETLNTSTRGSRREFPAVAVIVAEADTVTIYDGDDPSLPMWMVFNGGSGAMVGWIDLSSLYMVNGVLCVGSASFDLYEIKFLSDEAYRYTTIYTKFNGNILGRNDSSNSWSVITGFGIVNRAVNDVAMTVLPDAPIDPATGLPVPTIAVATDGGLSVIADSGAVYDSSSTTVYEKVFFSQDNYLYALDTSFADDIQGFGPVKDISADGFFREVLYFNETTIGVKLSDNVVDNISWAGDKFSAGAQGSKPALNFVYENRAAYTEGMTCFINSTYNTGWMNGEIKGAFLSDTDDTDLVGSGELVTNGTFDTDTSGWTAARSATLTWVSGAMQIAYGGTDYPQAQQTLTTVAGKRYKLQVTQTAGVSLSAVVGISAGGNQLGSVVGSGSLALDFVASSTTSYLTLQANSVGSVSVTVDNVSVKLADEDRSVNNNGLIVNGTVTRTPVATGADLVAYSGFSSSNYLEQPYNSDLDFGTGDFCVMGWVKGTSQSSLDILTERSDGASIAWRLTQVGTTNTLQWRLGATTLQTPSAMPLGSWFLFTAVRSSGVGYIYVNGRLVQDGAQANDVNVTDATLILGNAPTDLTRGFNGSLALWRISATAPTAEQIKKIYEDEKVLFQENAQATLYGSSDAVTALAHDPVTDLLHVGTSAGRSVFQGLRRVDNTTDAVGTAISASNNLVVDE